MPRKIPPQHPTINNLRAIAREYALVEPHRAFDRCYTRSEKVIKALRHVGIDARLVGGLFQADMNKRWARPYENLRALFEKVADLFMNGGRARFNHYWVEAGPYIVDVTGAQFGEPGVIITRHPDVRYVPRSIIHHPNHLEPHPLSPE